MSIRSRILDTAVSLADRIEDASIVRTAGVYADLFVSNVTLKEPPTRAAFNYALGCAGIATSLALRIAAKRLGRPSFSPLAAMAQGLDDEGLRVSPCVGDA